MKKCFFILLISLIGNPAISQQIGSGLATNKDDFNSALYSGVYTGLPNSPGSIPTGGYQHLFVIRHNNSTNNYQLQIASSIKENDRIFFRKIASTTLSATSTDWVEFSTRKSNTFDGNQIIKGNVEIVKRQANLNAGSKGILNLALHPGGYNGDARSRVITAEDRAFIDYRTESGGKGTWIFGSQFGTVRDVVTINGNTAEVVVDGKIRSEEIKVEIVNGPDYVFAEDYNLRTLEETKAYISENKHLPEIPSAKEMEANGIDLGDMNMRLLKKIEELTLYQIELLEMLEKQNSKIAAQQARIEALEAD